MILARRLAPAGTALTAGELADWLSAAVSGRDERSALADDLRARYGLSHVFLTSSARAGMSLLLRAIAERAPARPEVLMPGYTCYSVAASAIRAGCLVRPVDVDPQTLDLAPAALDATDTSRALALVATSLYGVPAALPRLEAWAAARGIALVDDAAQCLDGRVGDRWVGTFGTAGLFSFDKGKNLTAIQGGVIVTRHDAVAGAIARACAALPPAPVSTSLALGAKLLGYAALLRPRLYGLATAMVRLGETPFELEAPTTALPRASAAIVRRQLSRIARITAARVATAEALAVGLADVAGVQVPRPPVGAVHPRLALVFADPAHRDRALEACRAAGVGATGSYPQALVDVPGIRPHLAGGTADTPGARRLAAGILTLPTHAYVTGADVARIVQVLRRA